MKRKYFYQAAHELYKVSILWEHELQHPTLPQTFSSQSRQRRPWLCKERFSPGLQTSSICCGGSRMRVLSHTVIVDSRADDAID